MDSIHGKNACNIHHIEAEVLGFNLIYNMLVLLDAIDCIHVVKCILRKSRYQKWTRRNERSFQKIRTSLNY